MQAKEGKNPIVALILSLVIPGLGHFYLGSIGKGIMFLILQITSVWMTFSIILALIGIPLWIATPIWAAIDAYKTAKG